MIHRVIGLRHDGSFVELKRCTTREGAELFRKLHLQTGEFTNVLIFWVPKRGTAHSSTAPCE
ncbi:MAG TPA: hypothetical protein VGM05_22335 [Planctomycetaceae bacterium]